VFDPLSSMVFLAGSWTACGGFLSGADCNVIGCVVSRAGVVETTDVSGFAMAAGAAVVEAVTGAGEAGGVARCT